MDETLELQAEAPPAVTTGHRRMEGLVSQLQAVELQLLQDLKDNWHFSE